MHKSPQCYPQVPSLSLLEHLQGQEAHTTPGFPICPQPALFLGQPSVGNMKPMSFKQPSFILILLPRTPGKSLVSSLQASQEAAHLSFLL